jgi:hypothetical protein
MEALSPRRFQSGGGYTGYGPEDDFNSNNNTKHPSPDRLKQQQLALRMIHTDYNEGISAIDTLRNNNNMHIGTEEYDVYIRNPRQHYDFGRDDIDEAELIPPWETTTSREDYVHRCAERAIRRIQGDVNPTGKNICNINKVMKEGEQVGSVLPASPLSQSPPSPPKSTKSVSFNTRDRIHHWDDQLDQLKHVDEAFFAVAKYLLEDVHNLANNYLEKEEDDFELLHSLQGDGVMIGAGAGGIFAKLFRCGGINNITSDEGSYEDDNCKPYLGTDGEVLDSGAGVVPRKQKYKLTEKLIKDFEAAVKYRMHSLEDQRLTDNSDEIAAANTREIARKIEAYGLPKLWKNDCQVEEDDAVTNPSGKEGLVVSKKTFFR